MLNSSKFKYPPASLAIRHAYIHVSMTCMCTYNTTWLTQEKDWYFLILLQLQLTEYSSYNFGEMAFHGGFLGELVQWSDFIAVRIS